MSSLSPFLLTTIVLEEDEMSYYITGDDAAAPPPAETQTTTPAPAPVSVEEPAETGSIILPTILMYGVLFVAMYFILFRPQRKKSKEMKALIESIRPGDNIVTQSGLFGKVTDVGEDCYIVEFGTNRGVKIPVAKTEIAGIKSPKMTPPPVPLAKEG